jgi:putative DNA primase/helicase
LADADRDPELKEKIKLEGAGILNWALIGLERLRERKRFLIPPGVQGATDDFIHKNDIPKLFVEESGAKVDYNDQKCRTPSQELYDAYADWCKRNGHKPMSSTKMAEEWKRLGFEKINSNGRKFWQGIEISAYTTASYVP